MIGREPDLASAEIGSERGRRHSEPYLRQIGSL